MQIALVTTLLTWLVDKHAMFGKCKTVGEVKAIKRKSEGK